LPGWALLIRPELQAMLDYLRQNKKKEARYARSYSKPVAPCAPD
jgi:hypothetical protein